MLRSKDLHMAATIDMESRTIMVSGAIDVNRVTIVMRVPIPEPGEYTLVKAETNLTDEPWLCWQITLGEGVSLPLQNPTNLLLSRQFRKAKYLADRGAILFWDGEVRPGDAIFKMARLNISGNYMILSHNRGGLTDGIFDEDEDESDDTGLEQDTPRINLPGALDRYYEHITRHGFGDDLPKIEVETPVRIVQPGEIDILSFTNLPQAHSGGIRPRERA
ncbi:DUF6423 family protein [Meiothermus sp.]|uniref:DUF6423 family protein n=1 Tax=Meiothermus sp. TaxID=1955249 RepID=UPI00307E38CF